MSGDFDKSDQKKTEYVLVDIHDVGWSNTSGEQGISGRKLMKGRIQDEINKRPNMRLVNIIPFSSSRGDWSGGHHMLHLLFEEREHNLDSIREDIAQIRNNSEKNLKNWESLFNEGI